MQTLRDGAQNHYPTRPRCGAFPACRSGSGLSGSAPDLSTASQDSPQTGTQARQTPRMTDKLPLLKVMPGPRDSQSSGVPRTQGKGPAGGRTTGMTPLKAQAQGKTAPMNSAGGASCGEATGQSHNGQRPEVSAPCSWAEDSDPPERQTSKLTWGRTARSTGATTWSPARPAWGRAGARAAPRAAGGEQAVRGGACPWLQ